MDFPVNRFYVNGDWTKGVTPEANIISNYWSDQAQCSGRDRALCTAGEGIGIGVGIKRQLTLLDVYANALGQFTHVKPNVFCDSIVDSSGTHRKPIPCGGNDPDIFNYSPAEQAAQNISGDIQEAVAEAAYTAEQIISENRKQILIYTAVVVVIIIVLLVIWKI